MNWVAIQFNFTSFLKLANTLFPCDIQLSVEPLISINLNILCVLWWVSKRLHWCEVWLFIFTNQKIVVCWNKRKPKSCQEVNSYISHDLYLYNNSTLTITTRHPSIPSHEISIHKSSHHYNFHHPPRSISSPIILYTTNFTLPVIHSVTRHFHSQKSSPVYLSCPPFVSGGQAFHVSCRLLSYSDFQWPTNYRVHSPPTKHISHNKMWILTRWQDKNSPPSAAHFVSLTRTAEIETFWRLPSAPEK